MFHYYGWHGRGRIYSDMMPQGGGMDVVSLLQNYAIELNEGKKSVKSDWMMTSIGNSYSPNDL